MPISSLLILPFVALASLVAALPARAVYLEGSGVGQALLFPY